METASLQLPKDLIESAIKGHIQKALSEAFADNKTFINQIVSSVINQKVDENLKPCSYSSAKPMIEQTLCVAMREIVKDILAEEMAAYKKNIKEALLAEMRKKNSPMLKQLVESMATGMISSVESKYRFTVSID